MHINSLTHTTRMLVLSKIDYGLYIYGHSPKSTLKIIKPTYHNAARRSINAFPTSPIINILAEAGLPTIEERRDAITDKLLAKLVFTKNSIIYNDVKNALELKVAKRIPSAIASILAKAAQSNLPTKRVRIPTPRYPPWSIYRECVILTLAQHTKTTTSKNAYKQLFSAVSSDLKADGWKFIFTDGSKTSNNTSFAVVYENGSIASIGNLPDFTSVFTAEAFAILQATKTTTNSHEKYIICSDSISVLNAVNNPKKNTDIISDIRYQLGKSSKNTKLMWTPGHVGIPGNEYADIAANSAKNSPVYSFNMFTKLDLLKTIQKTTKANTIHNWSLYHHHHKKVNPEKLTITYPTNVSKQKISNFVRLRLGHTSTSHQHLLNKNTPPPLCATCHTSLNLTHILEQCSVLQPIINKIFKEKSMYEV
ncbi:uncharacterized protein LOC129916204 [Episyrphus balteatus]|uniref:uncharacterized protein LOC129916204 n=1 Tax=Episyrphus balteatus TaxID=286459 RepID=UPI002486093A|nr:uncharacterized protein LOC129916204 [Episyrphus balteatus]